MGYIVTILRLGVIDLPYVDRESPAQQNARVRRERKSGNVERSTSTVTTGDVAEILEEEYHVMEVFFEATQTDIGDYLAESLAGALETVLQQRPGSLGPDPYKAAEAPIKERFDDFIANGEIEALGIKGVPTKAAIDGVNHRLKRPYAKSNPRRPSFVDTGLYLASFAAEIADK